MMKGYKAFNENLTCMGMQYEIGKTYEMDDSPIVCRRGFHFCKSVADCYRFYATNEYTRICEVKVLGEVVTDDEVKYCTNKIVIVKEVKNPRVKSNTSVSNSGYCNSGNYNSGNYNSGNWNSGDWNSGDYNSGNCNSGNYNSGNWNSGDYNSGNYNSGNCNSGNCNSGNYNSGNCNSGDYNSGDYNSGNCNSGNYNSGNCNSGDYNSGNCNSGDYNSGNCNSGDYNSGNLNSGAFCTSKNPTIKLFDKDSDWTIKEWKNSYARHIMAGCPCTHSDFIGERNMTKKEKENHPEYNTIGGYVKTIVATRELKQEWWNGLSEESKKAVISLPNFDSKKFEQCTGIKVEGVARHDRRRVERPHL